MLAELQLYGYRPFEDVPDPRPLPDGNALAAAIADIFDALVVSLSDTRLEPDLETLLWNQVNIFHAPASALAASSTPTSGRSGPRNPNRTVRVAVGRVEKLIAEGLSLVERRDAFELMRDQAADLFERHTGTLWRRAALRLPGQPPHADRGHDRQPGVHRRQAPGRERGAAAQGPRSR